MHFLHHGHMVGTVPGQEGWVPAKPSPKALALGELVPCTEDWKFANMQCCSRCFKLSSGLPGISKLLGSMTTQHCFPHSRSHLAASRIDQ